jgi:hypothetical protein
MAQFKRVRLRYKSEANASSSSGMVISIAHPTDDEKTKKGDTEIQNLITQGWRIVSTAPVTGSYNILNPKGENAYHTYTTGIEVFMVKE